MLLLKACPRCNGDLTLERDRNTTYLECVQCGHIVDRLQERALGLRTTRQGLLHLHPGEKPEPEREPVMST
jgi:hypothetical protein